MSRATKRVAVVHTAESPETLTAAEAVARYLAGKGIGVHHVHDADSTVSPRTLDQDSGAARGLPAGAGVHSEHAGTAHQTAEQWADERSEAMLQRSAMHLAADSRECDFPLVRLTPGQLKAGARGVVGHIDVTLAYGVTGGHWDPGTQFPWDHYLAMARYFRGPEGSPLPTPVPDHAAVRRWVAGITFNAYAACPNLPDPNARDRWSLYHYVLQDALNVATGCNLARDGFYGPATTNAVLLFQLFLNKLQADAGKAALFPAEVLGLAEERTRWMLCTTLARIRDGAL